MKKLIAFFLLIALCVTAQLWSPGSGGGGGSGGSASVTNAVDQISTNGVLAATGITTINYSNATVYKVGSTGFVDIASSGGGTPAGGNGQIQFNDGGAFGGSTNMIFSDSLNRLSLNGASLLFSNSVFSPSLQAYAPGGLVVSAGDGSTSLRLTAGDLSPSGPSTSLGSALEFQNIYGGSIFVNGETADRPAYINASKEIVSATGSFTGTEFMRGDGVLATPSGSGGGGAGSLAFDLNQFDTNVTVTIKNGAVISGTNLSGASITPRLALTNSVYAASNTAHSTAIMLSGKNSATAGTTNQIQSEFAIVWVPTANTIGSGTLVFMSRTNAGSGAWTTNGTLSSAGAFTATGALTGGENSRLGNIVFNGSTMTGGSGAGGSLTPQNTASGPYLGLSYLNSTATNTFMWNARPASGASNLVAFNVNGVEMVSILTNGTLRAWGDIRLYGGLCTQSGYIPGNTAFTFLDWQSTNSALYVTNLGQNLIINVTNLIHRKDFWVDVATDGTPRTVTIATNGIASYRVLWGINAGNSATNSVIVTNFARINIATTRPGIIAAAVEHQQ